MTFARALAKNTTIQLLGKAASTALGMVAVALMTRSLGVEQFGWYITAVGFLQFIGLISDFGFTVTTSNLLAEPTFDKRAVLNVAFSWRFVSALVFQLLAPLIVLFFPYRLEIKEAVAIATISFFALSLAQVFIGAFRENLNIHIPVIAELIGRVILVFGVALAFFTHAGFIFVMSVITLASVTATAYMWWRVRPLKFNFNRAISLALWHKLAPTALTVMFNAVYLQGDRLLLPLYVDQTHVGFYGASYRVLDIIIQVASLVMGLIMPLITYAWSRQLKVEFKERLDLGFTLLAMIIVPMAAGVMLLAKPIMIFIAGAAFAPAAPILTLLTISMFGVVFGMSFGHIMLAINRQREATYIYGACALVSLAGYLILIPRFGVNGAIGITIFSEWFTGIGLLVLTKRYSKTLPALKPFLQILIAALVMVAVIAPLQNFTLLLTIPLGALVYGLILLVLGVVRFDQIKLLFTR